MERTTFEQDLAAIKARGAARRALAAMPVPDAQAAPASAAAGQGAAMHMSGANAALGAAESVTRPLAAVTGWVKNLPKNIGKGTLDAAVNSLRAANDIGDTLADFHSPGETKVQDSDGSFRAAGEAELNRMDSDPLPEGMVDPGEAYDKWRTSLNEDDNLGDTVTQSIAQFMVPFTAWSKAAGGYNGLSTLNKIAKGVGIESLTAGTAWAPHDPRLADLVDLGRQSETKFGDALRAIAPDGSLLNSYIDYMTERDGETELEGRFKNAVDSLAGTALVAGLIKSVGLMYRAGRNLPEALQQNPTRPGSLKSQRGGRDAQLPLNEEAELEAYLAEEAEFHNSWPEKQRVALGVQRARRLEREQDAELFSYEPADVSQADEDLRAVLAQLKQRERPDGTVSREDIRQVLDGVIGPAPKRPKLSLVPSEPRHSPLGNVADSKTGSVLDNEFVVPGSQVLTVKASGKPAGFIAFKEADDGSLQINRAKVADESQGQGLGKKLLLEALAYADKVGRPLTSDNTVTVAQLRVYESLQRAGKIKVTYSDPAAVEAALKAADARVPVKGKGGKPVATKIELVKGE